MGYKTLSRVQIEELISYELSKSAEYFLTAIDELINKYQLLNRPDSAYTKVHLTIKEYSFDFPLGQYSIRFDKFYPISSVKRGLLIDFIANSSSIVKSIKEYNYWDIGYDIRFFKSDGTPNGGITDNHINPSVFKEEFLKIKGWEQYIA